MTEELDKDLKILQEKEKYKKGIIYKIKSDKTDKIYIGCSLQSANNRLSKHKYDYKRYKNNNYNYVSSFEIIQYDDCKIEILLEYPCDNKKELEEKESEYINKYNNVVNIKKRKINI